jgi:hypothetical protein
MKSFIAALRSLVLPFGATSGPRIVLDGVNGRIEVYNAAGVLVGVLDGITGFQFTGSQQTFHVLADGNVYVRGIPETGGYVQLADAAGFGGLIFLQPEDSTVGGVVFLPAALYADSFEVPAVSSQPYLEIDSPCVDGAPDLARAQISLVGQRSNSVPDNSHIDLFADQVSINVGATRPDYHQGEYGSFLLSFGPANSASVAVTYAKVYSTPPLPIVNIDTAPGVSARWVPRAINRTTTGFTFFVFAADAVANTWVNQPLSWATIVQP